MMERIGYEVANVGEREVRDGYERFERLTRGRQIQFVSANIIDPKTDKPVFLPHVVLRKRLPDRETPFRIGVTGAVRYNQLFLEAGPGGSQMTIAHPVERVKAEVAALEAEGVDLVVLLGALPKQDLMFILDAVPRIDYALCSYGGAATQPADRRGATQVLYVGNRGQRLSENRLFIADTGEPKVSEAAHNMHFLALNYPVIAELQTIVDAVLAKAGEGEGEGESDAVAGGGGAVVQPTTGGR
jgi:hypothetical protein